MDGLASAGGTVPRRGIARASGPAAMAGGALLVCATALRATKPRGCVAEECATSAMRQTSVVEGALLATSLLLIVVGAVGLVSRARASGRFGRVGRAGSLLAGAAVAALAVAALVQLVFFDGDFPYMPHVVVPSHGYNEQTAAVLMALPLALAWIAVGYELRARPRT